MNEGGRIICAQALRQLGELRALLVDLAEVERHEGEASRADDLDEAVQSITGAISSIEEASSNEVE
jgi:hypothetical protein